MNIRLILALWVARLTMFMVRITGQGKGSALPGRLALKICPNILKLLGQKISGKIIIVTGTNGKTTTNNMIANILGKAGYAVVVNREGANLITGVTTALIQSATIWGKMQGEIASLEVDEASFPKVVRNITPQVVVVTNFFRDQLDRYGELDKTVSLVGEALHKLDDVTLILNADDPLVAQLAKTTGKPAVFYGLHRHQGVNHMGSAVREAKYCPICGEKLQYAYYHYSQLGEYHCPGCDFARPQPDLEGVQPVVEMAGISCDVRFHHGGKHRLRLPVNGFYNLYNGLAAWSTGLLLEIKQETMEGALASYQPATGRMERLAYQDKPVLLNLVKNPTGFNEGLHTLLSVSANKVCVCIAIHDNDADGRDISWLWDVDFEELLQIQDRVTKYVCTGLRAWEMAVRLKYAGLPFELIVVEEDMAKAVQKSLYESADMFYFLSTYTALWPMERILGTYAKKEQTLSANLSSLS